MKHGSLIAWALLLLVLADAAFALNPQWKISQYGHTAWRLEDGLLPASTYPIAQSLDGYLWIGTQAGLVHFDGVRFVPLDPALGELPDAFITSLRATRDGALWIGTGRGLARLRNGVLTRFPEANRSISATFEDSDGVLWFTSSASNPTGTPLCRVVAERVECFGAADGLDLPPNSCCIGSLLQDSDGSLLLSTDISVLRWKRGSKSTQIYNTAKATAGIPGVLVLATRGTAPAWVGVDATGPGLGLNRLGTDAFSPVAVPGLDGTTLSVRALYVDSHDTLWIGTLNDGIWRLRGNQFDHFRSEQGLSGSSVYWFYEDREGNLWVSTSGGLDRFRDLPVITFSHDEGLSADEAVTLLATRDSGVWVANPGAIDQVRDDGIRALRQGAGLPGNQVTAMLEDHAGRQWIGIDNALYIYDGKTFTPVPGLDGATIGMVYSLAEDTDRNIWARVSKKLVRIRAGKALDEVVATSTKLAADPAGGLWLGLRTGGLARYRDGALETLPLADGADRPVLQLTLGRDSTLYASTESGLLIHRAGRQRLLRARDGLPCDGVTGALEQDTQALWLYTRCGLVRIALADLQRWWQGETESIASTTLDRFDGVRPGRAPFRNTAQTADGRLWFVNAVNLQTVDPTQLPPVRTLPALIERVQANETGFAPAASLVFGPQTTALQVDYTALALGTPQKVAFRYRLHGLSSDWQDAGSRRQAFFTALTPGDYRFEVAARYAQGPWSETPATLAFRVLPAWYQTWWFRVALASLVLLAFWLAVAWYFGQAARRARARMEERIGERERIARELHDTLLQGVQGLLLRVHAVSESLPPAQATTRDAIEQALDRAEHMLVEGRDRVRGLRAHATGDIDLASELRNLVAETGDRCAVAIALLIEGGVYPTQAAASEEIYFIASEAVANAVAHAAATRIDVTLSYSPRKLRLRVRDDGCGVPAQWREAESEPGTAGHFGLQGMRERARRIGGTLLLHSSEGGGTCIDFQIPARHVAAPREGLVRRILAALGISARARL
ncbi:signal transduction histidine kinase [Tahibacter aquaticus]|uniref:Signal transduction histidine kinase n=1 Tax=Tahibacter aquaticus TaxID=520092 RepID=A0A4R6YP12_9GAMM|nr:sensor histidine kinase [Tahibacter aquaticus]TDR39219.1 signal transduction histidine kinase [Tahibacter aquaticus]